MIKKLFGIDIQSIKYSKNPGKDEVNLDLELILKNNWDPKTREIVAKQKQFLTQDLLIKWATENLEIEKGLSKFWADNFLNKNWLVRVLSFAVLFVVQWILNYFKALQYLVKNQKTSRIKNEFTQIYSFIWLFSVQQFMQYAKPRITTVNVVENRQDKFLLALRRHQWIPGDQGWGWFQGGLEVAEEKEFLKTFSTTNDEQKSIDTSITKTSGSIENIKPLPKKAQQILINRAKQELKEETNLDLKELNVLKEPKFSGDEVMSISIKRFLLLGCKYNLQRKYLVYWFYSKDCHTIKTDFENAGGEWFFKDEVGQKLVPEKLRDWEEFLR